MNRPTGIRIELEQRIVRNEFEELKEIEIVGNAYSDHNLLNFLPDLAVRAASANLPDLAFEIYDYLGTHVMGVEPLTWEDDGPSGGYGSGFPSLLQFWHREIWPSQREAEERRQEENEDASWPWGRP